MTALQYLSTYTAETEKQTLLKEFCKNIERFLKSEPDKQKQLSAINAHLEGCDINTMDCAEILRRVKEYLNN